MNFLFPRACINPDLRVVYYFDDNGEEKSRLVTDIAIIAPPIALFNSGRHIYLSLANIIDEQLSGHQYVFLISRFEEKYYEKYHTSINYTFPKFLEYIRFDKEMIKQSGAILVMPKCFEEAINNSGESLKSNIQYSSFDLQRHRFDLSDAIISSIADGQLKSIKLGYEYKMNNPLLAEQEYVDLNVNFLSEIIKKSIIMMKQAIMEKISKYQEYDQSLIWGLLE